MWSEKYRPQIISDMVGNEEPRAAIMEWFAKWKKGTKPLLIVGPPCFMALVHGFCFGTPSV